jgi:PAS domain S-box-containing protein
VNDVVHEASLTLEPRAISARLARVFLADLLRSSGDERWLEAAQLALSEVVTNGVLHAHTDLVVTARVHSDHLRVEVRDLSPRMPVQRTGQETEGGDATTGRGMGLVSALTAECGVHPVLPVGKVVWFVVRDSDELSADDLLAAWDVDELLATVPAAQDEASSTTVVLRGLPPTLYLVARDRHIALLRELALHAAAHPETAPVDSELAEKARTWVSTAVSEALEDARAAGLARRPLPAGHPASLPDVPPVLDVPVRLPRDGQSAVLALQELLDGGERLARAGRLLLRPGLPEMVALRDWICDSLVAGLGGVEPGPWAGVDQERFADRADSPAASGWDASVVTGSTRGVVAADDANRIVAVSASLAALVGWDADDLVGRRVVTLIPPSLREAHVAGFTRHLTTGQAQLLGVPLQLPVLHREGHEVACDFLIEQAPGTGRQHVYLAWISRAD